jgi:hypothetical protein
MDKKKRKDGVQKWQISKKLFCKKHEDGKGPDLQRSYI